jgi:hypothetical protein
LLTTSFITLSVNPISVLAETPVKIYTGISNAREIINNIKFTDIGAMPSTYWAKDAIYEMAGLEAVKGYGDKKFRPDKTLSKEEAMALIYRMLGQEAAAQKAAEVLDAKRGLIQKKNQPVAMWADGYLQLAANDGLITQSDFQTAMQKFQPKPGTKNKFVRADLAQRQEVAYWAAKAIKLSPVYGQQVIFNSYNDWSKSDPVKVPYIEAILQKKIINGKTGANFNPLGSIRRDEMSQMLKNMEDYVLPIRLMEKKKGYVEAINENVDQHQTEGVTNRVFSVRGDDGKFYQLTVQTALNQKPQQKQEFNPGNNLYKENEIIVYRNGNLGTSETIQQNDQLEFIVNSSDEVRFVKARPSSIADKAIRASVAAVDQVNGTVSIKGQNGNIVTYKLKGNAEIVEDKKIIPLSKVKVNRTVNINLDNNQIVMLEAIIDTAGAENGDIAGIVEDNNPSLQYISLYDQQGEIDKAKLRVYNYIPDVVQVQRNGKKAKISEIQPGDTVHIILGDDGNVNQLSGVDNYEPAYGKIISKDPASIAVEYNDGSQQVLPIKDNIIVISEKKAVTYGDLREGDFIRMLLQKTPDFIKVKEITTQTYTQDISNVYKAILSDIDTLNGKIMLKHPEKLYKGDWERTEDIGFLAMPADDTIRIFDGSTQLDIDKAKKSYLGREVYAAAKRSYGNQEVVQMLSFRDPKQKEVVYDDTITSISDSNQIGIEKAYNPINFNEGTIVVKNDRLVTGRSLAGNDNVYVAANRDAESTDLQAGVIMTATKPNINLVQIIRGKLENINTNKDFTLQTFSILDGLTWRYNGFKKTYSIGFDTRVIGDGGVISTRDFSPYAETSYIDKPIYVIANETEALLISTAPFGAFNAGGEVSGTTMETSSSTSGGTSSSTKMKLINASVYNKATGVWENKGNIELGVLQNTIVIKNGEIVSFADIEKGDIVRILKKDGTTIGDAYLILVEK